MHFQRAHLLPLLSVALLSSCAIGRAREDAFHAQGLYIGVMQSISQIHGDFDGEQVIIAPDDMGAVPSFDGEVGVGIAPLIGYRWHRRALELSGHYTDYGDPEFFGAPIDAQLWGVSLDWKEYYNVDGNLQPFLFVGLAALELQLEDAAVSLISPETADVVFSGVAVNVGGGANFYLTRHLAVFGQLYWSFVSYQEAETVFPPKDIDGQVDGDSWTAAFGVSWTF